MDAYYNDNDRQACAWLRELQKDGLVMGGAVDERSISDVKAEDLAGKVRCHFFAGIGGWDYALQLAGWPRDREVWTGSCPCQPFSAAGKRRGKSDERHLWPEFLRLISERRPAVVFGEQVASNLGRDWLAGVRSDMEALGYAVGAADLCAAGVGAPHIRQRLYWVAYAGHGERGGRDTLREATGITQGTPGESQEVHSGRESVAGLRPEPVFADDSAGHIIGLDNAKRHRAGRGNATKQKSDRKDDGVFGKASETDGRLDDSASGRREDLREPTESIFIKASPVRASRPADLHGSGLQGRLERRLPQRAGERAAWSDSSWIDCRDGKDGVFRKRRIPIEPTLFPLAHGVPGRVGILRGAGNSIVPEVAAAFIRAFMQSEGEMNLC